MLTLARPRLAVAAVATGCAVLAARPLLLHNTHAVAVVVVLFAALLAVGVAWPAVSKAPPAAAGAAPVFVLGAGAFAAGRLLGGHAVGPVAGRLVLLNVLAAVAEEAFFRRLVFAALLPSGAVFAVSGSAVLFAAVHVTVYGAWVLPVDLAAGLVLSWQRWATGTWRVPALTHVLANLLVVI